MSNKFHIVYLAIIAVLLVVLGVSLSRPDKVVEVIKHQTDSLVIVKYDTLTITKVLEVEKKIVDTVYVKSEGDSTPIPISEYRFFKPNEYDITARGFNVTMPSITVFPKTITKTVTNTIEKEVVLESAWNCYLGVGIWAFDREIVPTVNLVIKTPKRWLFGLNIGYHNKRPIYGGSVNYKILGNKGF